MPQGRLRVYLGVAPGVGSTYALLAEARRRSERFTDVVIGVVDDHGRPAVRDLAAELPAAGPPGVLDPAAVLLRRPAVVLVDDLAQPNPPGSRRGARWQDVEDFLAAGIDVIATAEIRDVLSLADVVEQITGIRPLRSIPDRVLTGAAQIELVDMAPEALRRRLAHGSLYPPERLDAELVSTFRTECLGALRELAMIWVAGVLRRSRSRTFGSPGSPGSPADRPEVAERMLVGLSGGPESERLLYRAARMVARTPGAELLAVHVLPSRRLPLAGARDSDRLRELAESVGAGFSQVIGDDVAVALHQVALAEGATQLVVGADGPVRGPAALRRPGTAQRLVTRSGDLDVHVVTAAAPPRRGLLPTDRAGLSGRRRRAGFLLSVLLPALLVVGLQPVGDRIGLTGEALLFLLAVVISSRVGGLWPALLCAVVGTSLLNWFFIPPVHTFWVNERNNVLALAVFVLVAALVSGVVDRAAALAVQAARASAESRTLAAIAGGVLRGEEALPALLERVRSAFGLTSVTLLERAEDVADPAARWRAAAAVGPQPASRPEDADVQMPAGTGLVLALRGRTLAAADRTVLAAFAAQAQSLLERDRLARAARTAARLEATERLRDALLAAVGHDLRTPLASAKAAVTSLRSRDVAWSPTEREELLATAEESLDRLGRLVADLLDLSRLQAGVLRVEPQTIWSDDVLATALDELGDTGRDITTSVADDVPGLLADPALLQRALVNLLTNALRYSPPDRPPTVVASALGARVELRVIDRGPGIPAADRARVFAPFQRLGDTDNATGLGLGLALSRGLVEAMGGTLEPEDTPGGGLTMVIALPAAGDGAQSASPGLRERAVEEERA
jgi:two-component system sensor histidine kinase KdpD